MASLAGKVALVTGGAQGIGLVTTRLLLDHGAKIGVLDVTEKLDSTCRQLEQQYGTGRVQKLQCDVTDSTKLAAMFARTKDTFGSLDIVCNNAGVTGEKDWEKSHKLLLINLHAVLLGTMTGIEHMAVKRGGKGGVVINVSSMAELYPAHVVPVYSAAKSGVISYTRAMGEMAESNGVRVNCICPWFTDTPMARGALDVETFSGQIAKYGFVKPSMVAKGILELITDTTRSGAVMKVTPTHGLAYHDFNAPPPTPLGSEL